MIGNNKYCSEPAMYSDGPKATASDQACKQRCVSNQGDSYSNKVSAQISDDGKTVYIRVVSWFFFVGFVNRISIPPAFLDKIRTYALGHFLHNCLAMRWHDGGPP